MPEPAPSIPTIHQRPELAAATEAPLYSNPTELPPQRQSDPRPEPCVASLKRRLLADQQKLLEVTRCISRIQEPQHLFQTLVDKAAELTGAERGYLLLRTSGDGSSGMKNLDLTASRRLPASELTSTTFRASRTAILDSIRSGRTVYLEAGATDEPSQSIAHFGVRAVLAEPITLHGQVLGVLYLDSVHRAGFCPEHVDMLPSFAAQAAICLENLRLVTEREIALRQQHAEQMRTRELEVFRETMASFLRMASRDLKGPLTVLKTGLNVLKRHPLHDDREAIFSDLEGAVDTATCLVSSYLDLKGPDAAAQHP